MKNNIQIWAVAADGYLLHAGTRDWECFGVRTIQIDIDQWERWADSLAAEHPFCPTARSRGQTARVYTQDVSTCPPGPRREFEADEFGIFCEVTGSGRLYDAARCPVR